MKYSMVIVPETHWDREWYLPWCGFRNKLVQMTDKLLKILETDPEFKNFTFDGQTVVLEDYLEARPKNRPLLEKYVKDGRISVGPFYILPDEFLVSGEALVRNLMLGHEIAGEFGRVMKAGYVPDPFGHVAQMPQIVAGFGINNFLFARGFGNEYEEQGLKMDFEWQAPGNAASVLGIHLIQGYGNLANISTQTDETGMYVQAHMRIAYTLEQLKKHAATRWILLNNGSDHLFAQPEIPEIIRQWNENNDDSEIINADFEYYANQVLAEQPSLVPFQGELRGGKYQELLSGTFSARMWIKQVNACCETLYEKYTEPAAALASILAGVEYPRDYIWMGWRWLLRNHPHDSICGCSQDQVHEEMRTRFAWAEQIGLEIYKDSLLAISANTQPVAAGNPDVVEALVYNPHPWPYTGPVTFDVYVNDLCETACPQEFEILNSVGERVPAQNIKTVPAPNHQNVGVVAYRFTFIARELPPCGYETYQFTMVDTATPFASDLAHDDSSMENQFYKVSFNADGSFNLLDKDTGQEYASLGVIEDKGDWGDEYDYSWPPAGAEDAVILSQGQAAEVTFIDAGEANVTAEVAFTLPIPAALADPRKKRLSEAIPTPFSVQVTLFAGVKRVNVKVAWNNQSKDHRVRMLFPSGIVADTVQADGHFLVIDRKVDKPDDTGWKQMFVGPNHQNMFVNVQGAGRGIAACNQGLPEYEAVREADGSVTLAVTLLRCIGWLSRGDFATRKGNAGPDISTPNAQMLGPFEANLAVTTHAGDWLAGEVHRRAREFNAPAATFLPESVRSRERADDILFLAGVASITIRAPKESTNLPPRLSAAAVEPKELEVTALKHAEDGSGTILRLVNMSEGDVSGTVTLWKEPQSVEVVDLNEQSPTREIKGSATQDGNAITVTLSAHVIMTLKLSF